MVNLITMKKSIVFLLHFLYWGPRFIILPIIILSGNRGQNLLSVAGFQLINTITAFICFYAFYLWLFPAYVARKKIFHFLMLGLSVIVILSFLAFVALNSLHLEQIKKVKNMYLLLSIVPTILFSGIIGFMFRGFISWYADIRVKEQLKQKSLQSELALLKAQINPHFLFNTINNIDILIDKNPATASVYLKQLSEMMRFMLYETSSELIPLNKELEYISKYIGLQKIRTANEKFVDLSVKGVSENLMIAPAIFIPFIENAFKHSTNKKIEDAIIISINIAGNDVSFTCSNHYDNSNSFIQEKSGLGIDLITQRLKLLYGDRQKLDIIKTDNRFEVRLKIVTK